MTSIADTDQATRALPKWASFEDELPGLKNRFSIRWLSMLVLMGDAIEVIFGKSDLLIFFLKP
jgi:hypothetical protein